MAKETKAKEKKMILEREYIVPLRREWEKVPAYKRAPRAVKALKEFLARHMGVYDRDLRKVKIDILLNNELRFRGIKKPPIKIKVKARKFDNGEVVAELVDMPDHIKYKKLREEKKSKEIKGKVKEIESQKKSEEEVKKEETKIESEEKKEEIKEKEEASKEDSLKKAKEEAKIQKHVSKEEGVKKHRRRDMAKSR